MKKRMSKAQRISMLEDRVSDLEAQQEHFYDGLKERLEQLALPSSLTLMSSLEMLL